MLDTISKVFFSFAVSIWTTVSTLFLIPPQAKNYQESRQNVQQATQSGENTPKIDQNRESLLIDCVKPHTGSHRLTQKECDKVVDCLINNQWRLLVSQEACDSEQNKKIDCPISKECGGGTKQLTQNDCSQTVCCQVGNKWNLSTKTQCQIDQTNVENINKTLLDTVKLQGKRLEEINNRISFLQSTIDGEKAAIDQLSKLNTDCDSGSPCYNQGLVVQEMQGRIEIAKNARNEINSLNLEKSQIIGQQQQLLQSLQNK